ncbi:MAG: monofunctional biosynthetic peptidoglycan transglycosylase, partial [Alcanivorax sp.]|nr:monofunctional biosynthetic peptidoglycan transglycosylase [Alcanivorax sp.]
MTLRYRILQCLALLFVAFTLSQLWYLGQVLRLQHHNPEGSAYMQRAKALGQVQQHWRDYDQ